MKVRVRDTKGRGASILIRLILAIGLSVGLFVLVYVAITEPPWDREPLPDVQAELAPMGDAALKEEKLRQEIVELELNNRNTGSWWQLLLSFAPFATAAVAVVGVLFTVLKDRETRSEERSAERRQRKKDLLTRSKERRDELRQRKIEDTRRFDTNFAGVVKNLGGKGDPLKASAAVTLETFLRPEYKEFHSQVFRVVLANLRCGHNAVVNGLLTKVFEKAIRTVGSGEKQTGGLDLAHANMEGINLAGVDLTGADVKSASFRAADLEKTILNKCKGDADTSFRRANLIRAKLVEAVLDRAECQGTIFDGATMTSTKLRGAKASGAQFRGAKLQSAHLEGADLNGAHFEGATLKDTFFQEAIFDDTSLRSISRTETWREAHFDPEIRTKLENLSGGN